MPDRPHFELWHFFVRKLEDVYLGHPGCTRPYAHIYLIIMTLSEFIAGAALERTPAAQAHHVARYGRCLVLVQHWVRHCHRRRLIVPMGRQHEVGDALCRGLRPIRDLTEVRRSVLQDRSTFLLLRHDVAGRAYLLRQALPFRGRRIAFSRPQQRGNEQLADQQCGYEPQALGPYEAPRATLRYSWISRPRLGQVGMFGIHFAGGRCVTSIKPL